MAVIRCWLVGRAQDCDVVVPHESVSAHHCQLTQIRDQFLVEDLRSTNGTFVNGRRITAATSVGRNDRITLGPDVPLPWPETRTSGTAANTTAPASSTPTTVITIGSDRGNDVVLAHPAVSARHARLLITGREMVLEDLASTGGTAIYAADNRIGRGQLRPEDTVYFGGLPVPATQLLAGRSGPSARRTDAPDLPRGQTRGLSISATGVVIAVPGKRFLEETSLVIQPGELVGLMGSGGAGKSKLMLALSGYLPPVAGTVRLGGRDLYEHYDDFRNLIGFAPQDFNIMHWQLTVRQVLHHTAKLRLPRGTSDAEIDRRINAVLSLLEIPGVKDRRIGKLNQGLSGGERTRVNLAMELLVPRPVLFLDEPTSNMSSEDALPVMNVIRSVADAGTTVLLCFHQPSSEIFRMLDNLLVVARDASTGEAARLVYYGPAYPDAVDFFNPDGLRGTAADANPAAEVLSGLGKQTVATWCQRYERSAYKRQYVLRRLERPAAPAEARPTRRDRDPSLFSQWRTLTERYLRVKLSDRLSMALVLAQIPLALLIVFIFRDKMAKAVNLETWASVGTSTAVAVFLLALFAWFFGCANAVCEIVGEWDVYWRERMVNLRLPTYVASKVTVLGLLSVLQCTILFGLVAGGCGLRAPWWAMLGVLVLVSWVGLATGLLISAVVRSAVAAISVLPVLLVPMVVLGGAMPRIDEMTRVVQPATWVVPTRWGFEAALLLEADRREREPALMAISEEEPPRDRGTAARCDMANIHFPKNIRTGIVPAVAALGVMFVSLILGIHLVLRARDIH